MHTDVTAETYTKPGDFVVIGIDAGYATHAAAAGQPLRLQSVGLFLERVLSSADVDREQPIFFADGHFTTEMTGAMIGKAYERSETDGESARVIVKIGDI